MNDTEFFSRERKAGYDPAVNASMNVLLLGTGALGQAAALVLALSQVGRLMLVDFDEFELSNATRSPLFGTSKQRAKHKNLKVACVAEQLAERTHWSDAPRIEYAAARVQELGDAPFAEATIVVCCVDDDPTRAWIATRCHRHGKPMVECGVAGAAGSFALYGDPEGPCWQCGVPVPTGRRVNAGCQANAIELAKQGFAAMTPTLSSVVGAYMAEAAIQFAHGKRDLDGRRVYINDIRRPSIEIIDESYSPNCPCDHAIGTPVVQLTTPVNGSARELLAELEQHFRSPSILLPAPYVVSELCPGPLDDPNGSCQRAVRVGKPDWVIGRHPRCQACGGSSELSADTSMRVAQSIQPFDDDLLDIPLATLGLAPSSWVAVEVADGAVAYAALPIGERPFVSVPKPRRGRGA
ncbi:Sulfur carrier protein ThiS adenylyltransferase [Botrimarina colliarenosi]|uniref:Sulfur carrier protein ThiS adenylyltransferase n=1 Tax=Botrimarina colliarenosi TaxID=2528001 RepID=A0A5C6A607_9BACT|nr:ThiF family adenylyltransferase [Botrimarina colliarenosi]TWT95384.1 Sulfur carrier protein ThiS adenylyltransferase [Botrimarina colliarenosi]